MSPVDPNPPVDPTASRTGEGEGVGAMLRRRRIELGLSQADVAHVVKLPERRIESMEQERWHEVPDGPYLRGFLRNVARALNLDAALLVERVDQSLMRSRNPESILVAPGALHGTLPRRNGPADDRRGGRALVFGAFVFAVIAALIAWSGTESFDRAMAGGRAMLDRSSGSQAQVEAPPGSRDPEAPLATGVVAPAPVVPSAPSGGPAALPAVAQPAPAPPGAMALLFRFNEDSWVEVRAADGKVLLSRLNAAGSEQAIEGEAPFSLIVGNARGVALRFRGQPVDLGPYTRDSVARFTLS